MAIRHRVQLSMLPSPVAVHFGSSQQLTWIMGFGADRERPRQGNSREGANERSRKTHKAITTRGWGSAVGLHPVHMAALASTLEAVGENGDGAGA